ncbi:DMT family transporter [Pseudomonas guariconensis]|uniref:DMT family transporter n=1 Tax=Pseudomonas guariconensis TaxID=1288410 RepID=UPI0018A98E58|nr:DMT family transporter [Pseudomonas guariconensis]MBF8743565.1 DMT family transporter [Pseudomonas guariconensis]MBF8752288.1 DMT family transporter [Pseudomonas guariconensis]
MSWLFLSLMAPLLWSLSNMIDKFAINNITSNYISFIFLLSIGNIFFAAIIYAFLRPKDLDIAFACINLISGIAIFLQYFAYSYSLEDMDVSIVIPIHQAEPLFVLIASALLFNSIPTYGQMGGFLLITSGILLLCASGKTLDGLGQKKHIMMILVSAFFGAASTVISDEILKVTSLAPVLLFNFLGYALGGLLLLLIPHCRRLITHDLKQFNLKQFGVFGLTNIFDVGGYIFFMAALSAGGGAALVSVVVSIHPLFVLLFGFLATRYFPTLLTEDIAPTSLLRKTTSILVIVAGVAVISLHDG